MKERRRIGQIIRKLDGRTGRALDDGRMAPHFLRIRRQGQERFVRLGLCDFREAVRRANMVIGITAHGADSEAEWLQSLVALGEWARTKLELTGQEAAGLEVAAAQAWEQWLAVADISREPRTLASVKGRWNRFERWAAENGVEFLGQMTAKQAREYIAEVAAAKASAKRDLQTLTTIWRDLQLSPVWADITIPRNAAPAPAVAARYRRLTTDELRLLVSRATGDMRLLFLAGICTGLRLSDLAALEWDDLRDNATWFEIIPGKTARAKVQPLSIPVAGQLQEALGAPKTSGRIFLELADIASSNLSKQVRAIFASAGISDNRLGKASFHSLRATFISLLDEGGTPPHVTDSITGHAKQGMHGRYTQPGMEAKRQAIENSIPRLLPTPPTAS